jgi:hypothetical protein
MSESLWEGDLIRGTRQDPELFYFIYNFRG